MINTNERVPVMLRVWRKFGGVFALFPTLPSDNWGYHCTSYQHIGQHSGATYSTCIKASRPATKEESAELVQELERIGYKLRVIKRASSKMHEERMRRVKHDHNP